MKTLIKNVMPARLMVVTEASARCMTQFAQPAARNVRFLSSPVRIALYTAASASRSN